MQHVYRDRDTEICRTRGGGEGKPAQGRGKNRAEARYNSQRRYNTQEGKFYGQGVGTMIRKVCIMTKG